MIGMYENEDQDRIGYMDNGFQVLTDQILCAGGGERGNKIGGEGRGGDFVVDGGG